MISRKLLIGLALVVAVWATSRAAYACTCMGVPPDQERQWVRKTADAASAIFTAEAVSDNLLGATLKVEKVWKGKRVDMVRMRHATANASGSITVNSCDYQFKQGRKYVVFANAISADLFVAYYCSPTGPVESAERVVKFLDDMFGAGKRAVN